MSACTDDILEDIATSLSIFEELQLTDTMMMDAGRYVACIKGIRRDVHAWTFQRNS